MSQLYFSKYLFSKYSDIEHYKKIADSVKLPIILYNVPSRTGCNILPQTVVKLCSEVHNIVGVKEASGNIVQITKLASLAQGKIDIYSGNDDHIVPILALGGKGVISVLSNVAPKQTHDICANFHRGTQFFQVRLFHFTERPSQRTRIFSHQLQSRLDRNRVHFAKQRITQFDCTCTAVTEKWGRPSAG